MWPQFHAQIPGKWVLAGEHSVLRGATAVALPHPEYALGLTFQPQVWSQPWSTPDEFLKVVPASAQSLIEEILRDELKHWASEGRSLSLPRGSLLLESSIPTGAGLGSSAALCVALARWLQGVLEVPESELFSYARKLEDRFHGRSSGMDIAAALAGKPIQFSMKEGGSTLGVSRLPHFTFHDTGLRSRTSECVAQVNRFRDLHPEQAAAVDSQMDEASRLAAQGLRAFDQAPVVESLPSLVQGMTLARDCFAQWGLVPPGVRALEEQLLEQGALAVKLTGAGAGGFVVALWAR